MKPLPLILLIITSFTISSCEKDAIPIPHITTGVYGTIKYGSGDCMPMIDESSRTYLYTNYNGEIYFIIKSDFENLGNGDFEQLKATSIHTTILNGELAMELPVNTYLVMPEDVYLNFDSNTITVEKGIALNKDFKFWKCTSY
jgi:hypothetical protein